MSAPSVTSTMPDSGSPASSSAVRASAWPMFERVPAYDPPSGLRGALGRSTRNGSSAARNAARAPRAGAPDSPNCLRTNAVRGGCVVVGDRHAARVVDEHGEEVALRFDGADDEHGPQQAEQEDGDGREAQAEQDEAGARAGARARSGAGRTTRARRRGQRGRQHRPIAGQGGLNASSPWAKITGRYLNASPNSRSSKDTSS